MNNARSAAGIVLKNNKIFIALRLPVGDMGNRWEFPGGKVEDGESYEETLIREYKEEFGVNVTVGNHIADASFSHNDKTVALSAYEVFFSDDVQKFILTEHSETQWVSPEEIRNLSFVDSDMLLYEEVLKYVKEQNR
ncbi:MAG: (deoxy)nucleoside triphosphate pyrophosphohydrolase [Treponema sp.]|nr:(deoxy)nucleoside triphosphate pyrophosphohydrolase [Candidatus Treponema caballi]